MPVTITVVGVATVTARRSYMRRVTDLYVTRGCLRRSIPRVDTDDVCSLQRRCVDRCSCIGTIRRDAARPDAAQHSMLHPMHNAFVTVVYAFFPSSLFPFSSFPFPSRLSLHPSRLADGRPDAVASRFMCNTGRPSQHFRTCKFNQLP